MENIVLIHDWSVAFVVATDAFGPIVQYCESLFYPIQYFLIFCL